MNVKTLVCNCKGLDPFRFADMAAARYELELQPGASISDLNPQFCAEGGDQILQDVLRSAEDDADTYVVVCACQQETQKKLFQKALDCSDFDPENFVSVDIRTSANDGILFRIHERLNGLAGPSASN
jgi:heterodisulfide reductase subunit A-like polyferredoxin